MDRNEERRTLGRRAIVVGAVVLVLAGVLAVSAQARGRGGREPSPDRQAARLADRLGLSAEQQAQVKTIFTESFAKRREIRDEGRRKMADLRKDTETRLSGVLTPEQMTELRSLREQRWERRGDRGRLPQGPGGPDAGTPSGPPPAGE